MRRIIKRKKRSKKNSVMKDKNYKIYYYKILKELPKMLKKNSRFRTQVLGILVEYLTSKTEIRIVIEEIKKIKRRLKKKI